MPIQVPRVPTYSHRLVSGLLGLNWSNGNHWIKLVSLSCKEAYKINQSIH